MLSEILTEKRVRLRVKAADWQQAIRAGGEILCRNGAVEPAYIEAAIQNVLEFGPYIVMTKGVAIPHAGSQFGVRRTAISLAALEAPVCFGSADNDPVRYVFTLAAVDADAHVEALRDLVALLGDPAFFAAIDRARSPRDIIAYIKHYEEKKGEKTR